MALEAGSIIFIWMDVNRDFVAQLHSVVHICTVHVHLGRLYTTHTIQLGQPTAHTLLLAHDNIHLIMTGLMEVGANAQLVNTLQTVLDGTGDSANRAGLAPQALLKSCPVTTGLRNCLLTKYGLQEIQTVHRYARTAGRFQTDVK